MNDKYENEVNSADLPRMTAAVFGHYTPLFPLPLIGASTVAMESLPSYFNRLAAAHRLGALNLCSTVILSEMEKSSRDYILDSFQSKQAHRFLFPSTASTKMVEILDLLTGQTNLHLTTVENLCAIIQLKNHLRSRWWWCPECMDERMESGRPLYFPLLWSVTTYSHCVIHSIPMIHSCQKCGMEWPLMGARNWTMECRGCGHSQMGMTTFLKNPDPIDSASWEWKASLQTRDCFQWMADGRNVASELFKKNLINAMAAAGGSRPFGRVSQLGRVRVESWRVGCLPSSTWQSHMI